MNRLTFSSVKETIASVLNLCVTDDRVMDYVNQAQERLLYKGKYVGTYGRYAVCLTSGCVTMPRQLETLESIIVCDNPGVVRGEWFEFLSSGPGLLKSDSDFCNQIVDRGEVCTFDDVTGEDKKLAIYADTNETAGAVVKVMYYDENGEKQRTLDGAVWMEGENITIPAPGAYALSAKVCLQGGLYQVVKPQTNGTIRLYEYDTVNLTYRALGYYEPDETIPVYRRYLIPGLCGSCCCGSVVLMGKMRFLPVYRDADFIQVANVAALKLMCQAIQKEENNLWDDAQKYEAKAVMLMEDQLRHYKGDGEIQPIVFENNEVTGPAVINLQ